MAVTISTVFTENATIYARWTEIPPDAYTVTFDANGGTVTPASNATGTGYKLASLPAPTRDGYAFEGWFTASTTGTAVTTSTVFSANTIIYARWTALTYTITYTLGGGTAATANPASYTIATASFTLNNPTRTGYTFAGWTGSNGTTAQTSVSINTGSTGDKSYTANWTSDSYTITYSLGGGTVATANPTSYTVETATFTLNNPTRANYTFAGWTEANGTTPQTAVSLTQGSTGDKRYTANWTPDSYTITYTLGGGTVATANPTSYTVETATFTLDYPFRTGYEFTGWTGTGLTTATKIVTIPVGSIGNRSYEANWTAVYYTLTTTVSPSSGGTVSRNPNQTDYMSGTSVTVTAMAASDYTFTGWSGSASGTASSIIITMDGNKALVANFTQPGVVIGGKKWMKKNLNIETVDSRCYDGSPDSCAKYGRLYTWEAAKTACPLAGSGWHLPSRAEWDNLAEAVGGRKIESYWQDDKHVWEGAGKKLKSTSGWKNNVGGANNGTNDFGFSALPGGSWDPAGGSYGAGYSGSWWSATASGSGNAYSRGMNYTTGDDVFEGYGDVDRGVSVRCVMDN
jgi:uncharacterized protein (TIGR02145 family)/uncharacterized repeat protein (TIGR02543 family)